MRVHNFYAGPACLPLPVVERIKSEFPEWNDSGMTVMEISHRSKEYAALHEETKNLLREIANIPSSHEILFIGGGATLQFAMVPLNLIPAGKKAAFVLTGSWAKKAYQEAQKVGKEAIVAASSEDKNFSYLPKTEDIQLSGDEAYVHITSNNTIYGTQYRDFPKVSVPLVCDMSSDILSHRFDVSQFDLIYAGAQKNLGPAGVTIIIAKKELLEASPDKQPTYLRYKTHLDKDSLYNTPPVFAIYTVHHVLDWIKGEGGLGAIESRNQEKADILNAAFERSEGFYQATVDKADRSLMNVTFRLQKQDLESTFIENAKSAGLIGLKGHRSVGGIRASIYNAVSLDSVKALADFMDSFRQEHA